MNDPDNQRDAEIAALLDEARAELRESGHSRSTVQRARDLSLAGDVVELLDVVQDIDAAVDVWRGAGETAVETGPAAATMQQRNPKLTYRPSPRSTATQSAAPPRPQVAATSPTALGRYLLGEKISAGGMGTVYRAHDPQLNRTVAVKVPTFEGTSASQSELRQRFMREARAAATVRHAHVCPIHDVGEHEGVPYIVMTLIEGPTLADLLTAGPLEPARALELCGKIALGLEAVHGQKLIHRDLKPRNILLDAQGEPHLTDFGLSRSEVDIEHLTREGMMVGTPAYMAPEQVEARPNDLGPRTDVYALGVLLYQMLTGRLPFTGNAYALVPEILHATPPAPSTVRAGLDPRLDGIVAKAMARVPAQRFASAHAFAEAIQSVRPDAPRLASPRAQWPGTRIQQGLIAAALALAVLVGGVVFRWRTTEGTLELHVNEPGAVVQVFNADGRLVITRPAGNGTMAISVDPGRHRLKIEKEGFTFFTQDLTIETGKNLFVAAKLMPLESSDRDVARWVLDRGGRVTILVADQEREVQDGAMLPADPFPVVSIHHLPKDTVTDDDLARLKGLTRITRLNLTFTKVTDAGMAHLSGLTTLRILDLNQTSISDAGLRSLQGLSNLSRLLLQGTKISDAGLEELRTLENLEALYLAWTQVTGKGLRHLKDLPKLSFLDLSGRKATATVLQGVALLQQLNTLALTDAHLTDESLDDLKGLPGLTHLFLGSSNVGDAGLAHLGKCSGLRELHLMKTRVTDRGLHHLDRLRDLRLVNLDATKVTSAGVAQLKRALPNCEIQRRGADTSPPASPGQGDRQLKVEP